MREWAHEEAGLTIDRAGLRRWSHWTPPPQSPRRFTTAFFVAALDHGAAEVVVDDGEIREHRGVDRPRCSNCATQGQVSLNPADGHHAAPAAACSDAAAAIAAAPSSDAVEHFATRITIDGDTVIALYHGDVGYETGDHLRPGPRHRLSMGPPLDLRAHPVSGASEQGPDEPDPTDGAVDQDGARRTWRNSRVLFGIWVVGFTLVVVPLVFSATTTVGPAPWQVAVAPALSGRTDLSLPPLGSVSAATHAAPVALRAELREVDVVEAIAAQGDPDVVTAEDPLPAIEAAVREDLGAAVRHLVVVLVGVSAGAGLLAAATFPGSRSPRRLAAAAAMAPLVTTLLVAPALIGLRRRRLRPLPHLQWPARFGRGAVDPGRQPGDALRLGRVPHASALRSARRALLRHAHEEIGRSSGDVVVLHISDLHLNTVGLALARDLAASFDVDAVLDTGDITSFGFEPEAAFTDLLAGFEVPYLLVAGNHDSEEVRARLAASDDVVYLDGEVAEVGGVRIPGRRRSDRHRPADDPRGSARPPVPGTVRADRGARRVRAAGPFGGAQPGPGPSGARQRARRGRRPPAPQRDRGGRGHRPGRGRLLGSHRHRQPARRPGRAVPVPTAPFSEGRLVAIDQLTLVGTTATSSSIACCSNATTRQGRVGADHGVGRGTGPRRGGRRRPWTRSPRPPS